MKPPAQHRIIQKTPSRSNEFCLYSRTGNSGGKRVLYIDVPDNGGSEAHRLTLIRDHRLPKPSDSTHFTVTPSQDGAHTTLHVKSTKFAGINPVRPPEEIEKACHELMRRNGYTPHPDKHPERVDHSVTLHYIPE